MMIKFNVNKLLPYSSLQIFDLVIDINSYPDFLPWCLSAKEYGTNKKKFVADLEIGYKFLKESFSSEVLANSPKRIFSTAISGPFKVLNNEWQFKDLSNNKCEVQLKIEFEFKSALMHGMIGKIFENSQNDPQKSSAFSMDQSYNCE